MEKMKLSGGNYLRIIVAILFLFLTNNISLKAQAPNQTQFATEADLKKQASKLFEDDKFEEAFPLYTQLTSIYPKDPEYNYRLGVCMLFSLDDKEKPIPYLEFASTKPSVDKEVFYYLAKAYHLNYRFDDAIKEYEIYKKDASAAKAEKLQVNRQIEMCKNGKMLLKDITDLVVIDKKEMNKEDFYRAYDISEIGGKLLAKPDEKQFTLPLDKKKKDKSIIYLAGNNNQVFFSSYGEDPSKGKDIYTVKRGPNGDWGTPQNLGAPVNTPYDEDYPFLHPNGKYLFFCSKGHNSMGGYDVFKSTFDSKTNTWGEPVNIDFPVNTPDDDVLYVTDLQAKQAYFSSARTSTTGKTEVYHINVERKKVDVIVIDGSVVKNRDGQKLDAKITVKDLDNNSVVGIYNAKPGTGEYAMNLPNGGKFLFTVELAGFDSQSEVVVLPAQNAFKPLKQEISFKTDNNKLVINTNMDRPSDDSNYLLALKYIKQKAKLDVMSNEPPAPTPAPVAVTPQPEVKGVYDNNSATVAKTNPAPVVNITNADAMKIARRDAREIDSTYKEARKQADIAYSYANDKNITAQNKTKESSDLFDQASKTSDLVKKQRLLEQANQANKEAEDMNQETVAAINFAKKLNTYAEAKHEEAKISSDYVRDLDAAIKMKNRQDAMAKLEQQEKKLDELSKQNSTTPTDMFGLKAEADEKKRELDKVNKKIDNLKQEIADNKTIEASTKAEMEKTKNLDLKKGLKAQIEGTQKDIKDAEKELAANQTKLETLTKEYISLTNQSNMIYTVVQQAKTISSEETAKKAASVDKDKLEKDMYEVSKTVSQNKVASTAVANNTNRTNDNIAPTKTEIVIENKNPAPVVKDNPKPLAPIVSNEPIDTSYTYILKNSDKSAPEILSDINKKYTKELADITKMKGGELKREEAKTETLKNWNTDLVKLNDKQKEELTPDADNNKKAVFAKNITEVEKQINALKVQSTEAVAKVETLKKKENGTTEAIKPVAENTSGNDAETPESTKIVDKPLPASAPLADVNSHYAEQMTKINSIKDELLREQARIDILKNWGKAIDRNIAKQKTEQNQTSDKKQKSVFAARILEAQQKASELKVQTNETIAKIETIQKQKNVVEKNTSNPAGNNSTIPGNNNTNNPVANNSSGNNNNNEQPGNEKNSSTSVQPANGKQPNAGNKANGNINNPETSNASNNNNTPIASNNSGTENGNNKPSSTSNNSLGNTNSLAASNGNLNLNGNNGNPFSASNNNGNVNNNKTNSVATPSLMKIVDKPLPAKASLTDINKHYSDEIAKVNKIENELVREDAKTQVLKYWNNALEKNIEQLKNEQKTVKTQTEKDASAKKINDVQKESNKLKKQTNDAVVKVETLKKQDAIAANNSPNTNSNVSADNISNKGNGNNKSPNTNSNATTASNNKTNSNNNSSQPNSNSAANNNNIETDGGDANSVTANNNTPIKANDNNLSQPAANTNPAIENKKIVFKSLNEINKKYNDDLVPANTINNPLEKEEKKTELLKNWNSSIEEFITKQKSLLAKANTQADKDTFTKKIADAQKTSASVKKQITSSVAKVDTLKKQNGIATTDSNFGDNNTTNNSSSPSNENSNSGNGIVSNSNSNNKSTNASGNKSNNKSSDNKLAPNESFEQKKSAVYSKAKPIPVDVKIPKGIIFQVQIGAFKKPIPQNLFEGITPITGVTASEGYTRYFAGMFVKSSSAENAKNQIKVAGYKDAFVVAYKDGVRIPLDDAKKLIGETPDMIASASNSSTSESTKSDNKNNSFSSNTNLEYAASSSTQPNNKTQPNGNNKKNNGNKINNDSVSDVASNTNNNNQPENKSSVAANNNNKKTNKENNNTSTENKSNSPEKKTNNTQPAPVIASSTNNNKAENLNSNSVSNSSSGQPLTYILPSNTKKLNDVNSVKGLFYTVQIGVFSQEVSAEKLKTNEQLYVEKTPNGYMRYNSGIYSDIKDASKSKAHFVELGLVDAFVTVYYNGTRLPLSEAKHLEEQARKEVAAINENKANPSQPIINKTEQPTVLNKKQPVTNNNKPQPIATNPVQPVTNINIDPVNSKSNLVNNNSPHPANTDVKQPVENNNTSENPTNKTPEPFVNNNNNPFKPITASSTKPITNNPVQPAPAKTTEPSNNNASQPIHPVTNKTSESVANKTSEPINNNTTEPVNNNSNDSFIGKVEDEPTTSQPFQPVVFDEKLKNELTNSLIHTVATPDTGIVYKIKLGGYKDDVPVEVANKFLKMKSKSSINFTTENGITVYTLGNFKDAKEATKIKSYVEAMNLKNVLIISYSDGKKLSDDKTNELINQH